LVGTGHRGFDKMLDCHHRVTNAEKAACFIFRIKAESSIAPDMPFISGGMTAQWNGRFS